MGYERENIKHLAAYTPGEQPVESRIVKLNTNENPYPASQRVLAAIRGVSGEMLRRYPSPRADTFRETAARVHGLKPEQVIATNGGDELLRLAVTVFCDPTGLDDRVGTKRHGLGMGEPSYSLYPVLARIHDTPVLSVALEADFSLPVNFARRMRDQDCRLVMIVNPHAPSGRLESVERLHGIAKELMDHSGCVLLIDEAYVDFAEHDALDLIRPSSGLDNVLLLRTLSKGYSLAGLRFGYGLGHPGLIAALEKAKDSYNTDILSQTAAVSALENRGEATETWKKVVAERSRMTSELNKRGFEVYPSQSNFLLVVPPGTAAREAAEGTKTRGNAPDARTIYTKLKEKGVLVRYFEQDRLRDKLRITVGTPEQDDRLLKELDQLKE